MKLQDFLIVSDRAYHFHGTVAGFVRYAKAHGFGATGQLEFSTQRDPKLHGMPIMEGLCGPMLDGGIIRYETLDVYEALSR